MRGEHPLEGLDLTGQLDPSRTALLVVDVQNDFCHPEGVFGRADYDLSTMLEMAATLQNLLMVTRRLQLFTVFIRATYDDIVLSPNLADIYHRRGFDNALCVEGSWGAAWYGQVQPNGAPHEVVLTKHRYSAFDHTPLDLYLRSNDIRTVILPGVATHCCVESTARDAAMRDYYVVVPEDGVAVRGKQRHLHEASLEVLGTYFGRVASSRDIESVWAESASIPPPDETVKSAAPMGIGQQTMDRMIDGYRDPPVGLEHLKALNVLRCDWAMSTVEACHVARFCEPDRFGYTGNPR